MNPVTASANLESTYSEMKLAVSTYATALGEVNDIQAKVSDGQSLSYDEK